MRFTLKEASFQKLRKKDQNVSTLTNRGGVQNLAKLYTILTVLEKLGQITKGFKKL